MALPWKRIYCTLLHMWGNTLWIPEIKACMQMHGCAHVGAGEQRARKGCSAESTLEGSTGTANPEVTLIPSSKTPPFFHRCSNELTDERELRGTHRHQDNLTNSLAKSPMTKTNFKRRKDLVCVQINRNPWLREKQQKEEAMSTQNQKSSQGKGGGGQQSWAWCLSNTVVGC